MVYKLLSIGTANLLVSFGLALMVALRSRQVHFNHRALLLKTLVQRFCKRPTDFFFMPKENKHAEIITREESKKDPSQD